MKVKKYFKTEILRILDRYYEKKVRNIGWYVREGERPD